MSIDAISIQKQYEEKFGATFQTMWLSELPQQQYDAVVEKMRAAVEDGGPVVVDTDLYPNADKVPADALY